MGFREKLKNRPGFRLPKFEPFHLKLSPSAGTYATNPRWSNKDLDPVPVKYRTWGIWDYFNYCTFSSVKFTLTLFQGAATCLLHLFGLLSLQ